MGRATHTTQIRNGSNARLRLEAVRTAVRCALDRYSRAGGEVSVLVTTDREVRRLNRVFRRTDAATDVLSFPAPETARGQIGDVAVAIGFARRQARARNVRIEDEIAMLAIHGTLHLCGFDDRTPAQRRRMLAAMNSVAEACGVATDPEWSSLPHEGAA